MARANGSTSGAAWRPAGRSSSSVGCEKLMRFPVFDWIVADRATAVQRAIYSKYPLFQETFMAGPDARPWPTELRVSKDRKALTVSFDNGESFVLDAELLRVLSPSAEVQGHSPD